MFVAIIVMSFAILLNNGLKNREINCIIRLKMELTDEMLYSLQMKRNCWLLKVLIN